MYRIFYYDESDFTQAYILFGSVNGGSKKKKIQHETK